MNRKTRKAARLHQSASSVFTMALDDVGVAETLYSDVIDDLDRQLDALYEKRDAVAEQRHNAKQLGRKLAAFVTT